MGDEGGIIVAIIGIIIAIYIIAIIIAILIILLIIALYGGSVFYLSKLLYNQTKTKYHLTNKSVLALVGVGIGSLVLSGLIFPGFWPIPVAILLFLILAISILWIWGFFKLKKELNPLKIDEIVLEKKKYEIENEIKNIENTVKEYKTDISFFEKEKGNELEEIERLNLNIRNICGNDRFYAKRKDDLIQIYEKYNETKLEELYNLDNIDESNLEYLILKRKLWELKIGDYKMIINKKIEIDNLSSRKKHLENILNIVEDRRTEVGNTIANKNIERIVLD